MRCRQIVPTDTPALIALLAEGFPARPRSYWTTGFDRLRRLGGGAPEPRYGYVLEENGRLVGVLLTLYAAAGLGEAARCNVSSWYVQPAYRALAPLLVGPLMRKTGMTLTNISPAAHTRPLIEVQGFRPYATGQFFAIPAVSRSVGGVTVWPLKASDAEALAAHLPENRLLADHAGFGCLCLVCIEPDGPTPFVFIKRRIGRGLVPAAQLIYCRSTADVVRNAGALGRHFLKRGIACVMMDANGPVPGLVGRYYEGEAPKYVRGPDAPRLGDLAYTELAIFGP